MREKLREIKEKYHYRNKDLAALICKNEYYVRNLLSPNCEVAIPKKMELLIDAYDNTNNIVEFENEVMKVINK